MINQSLWAKKSVVNGNFMWLPLVQHLYDTGEIGGLLWEHWLSQGQKEPLIQLFGSEEKAKEFAMFLCQVHDIGKAAPAFQLLASFGQSTDLDQALLEKLERDGFTGITSLKLSSPKQSRHTVAGQYILIREGVSQDIASIIGAHHGKPIDYEEQVNQQASYEMNLYQSEDVNSPIYQKWLSTQRNILKWALSSNGFDSVKDFPKLDKPLQLLLSGLVIMADWIASNEHYFPLLPIDDSSVNDKEQRKQNGWVSWFKTYTWVPSFGSDYKRIFDNRFGFNPNEVQSACLDAIDKTSEPGIYVLEAPTGIGKTEAALFSAELLAQKTGRSGLFFGLPTQATSDGIFPRVHNWLDKIARSDSEDRSLRLCHGKAALNEVYQSLSNNVNIDESRNGAVIINEWFTGRKTATLDDFVVGTVDHFLLIALKQKHLALRHLGFSKKVVIIDEVHAYDAYMNQYLQMAVKWMGYYRVPVIILSATLPADRREVLIKSYLLGRGLDVKSIKSMIKQLDKSTYPLLTFTDSDLIKQSKDFLKSESKNISISRIDDESLFELIEELFQSDGIMGIIVNTVRRAQSIVEHCMDKFGEDAVELLHSNFIATHRTAKEKQLMAMIGKKANRPKRKIIVGTQVIEQSLDIDFDVLITDLAPMDLLIQRIGRLHRHTIQRPINFQKPTAYVIGTSENFEFDKGSSAVYGDYLLLRTQHFLTKNIRIPDDISTLVQSVYDGNPIELPDNLIENYNMIREAHINRLKQKEEKAKTFVIEKPVTKSRFAEPSLLGFLKNDSDNQSEERAFAQVRDIESTIEVIALKKNGVGYGVFGDDKDISNEVNQTKIAKDIAKQTLRLPTSLTQVYNFDATLDALENYNLKYLSNWQEETWLKGSIGIIFDKNAEFVLNGFKLTYDLKLGLKYERM